MVNGLPGASALREFSLSFPSAFHSITAMTKTKREREKKAFYQRLFIKYSPVTKFCKASKGENRGSAVRHPAEKSSPGDEPHYLSIRRPENQANHTTNRRPITAPQNCSSTNQVLIPSSKKNRKKMHSAALQLALDWPRGNKPSRASESPHSIVARIAMCAPYIH